MKALVATFAALLLQIGAVNATTASHDAGASGDAASPIHQSVPPRGTYQDNNNSADGGD